MAFMAKIEPYKVYEYSWTSNLPSDHEIDFEGLVNTLTVIHAPPHCSVKLESSDNDEITDIADDEKIEGITFSKVFVTSSDTTESIKFFAAWVT